MWSSITIRADCHNRPKLMDDLRKNICGKVHRDPVPGTLEVYPLKGYGAVATGLHRFCDSRKYRTCVEGESGVAKFVTLWRKDNGKWAHGEGDQLRPRVVALALPCTGNLTARIG